jgi:hypothetical protein
MSPSHKWHDPSCVVYLRSRTTAARPGTDAVARCCSWTRCWSCMMGSLRRAGRQDPATCVAVPLPAASPNIPEHFVPEETKDRSERCWRHQDGNRGRPVHRSPWDFGSNSCRRQWLYSTQTTRDSRRLRHFGHVEPNCAVQSSDHRLGDSNVLVTLPPFPW